ncbi:MAG: hypothetical protein K0M55_19945 [Rhizobium sp.]|nr:hypothetical protein [Rhizobium sp.]MBW8445214.1 hypothetical protein [Arenimonas sp.]
MSNRTFNATDMLDVTAEQLRVAICVSALSVIESQTYRKLQPEQQVEAIVTGCMAGLFSVAFACIDPAGRDDMTAFIKAYTDQARAIVESLSDHDGVMQ